ncbi:MAG TPA: YebC/PmpR family DNA-binding transcriptional regulator [Myxococcota bacterium]|nr:YebC/PmpR family DNA-binding transcriptional regulator [Myxococcota bacterium]
MAGHSKWANIKRRKGAQDAKRGKLFTKLIKEIMVAAKMGGGDLDANPRLRLAVDKAKANSMPKDNIARAIAKGSGELGGDNVEEFNMEGYGPGGVAVLVEVMTDNRNRTAAVVRHAFSRCSGNLGTTGCVSYMFHRKGMLLFGDVDEDELMMAALDAGAEDLCREDDVFEVTTDPAEFMAVKDGLAEAGFSTDEAELTYVPDNRLDIEGDNAETFLKMIDLLEDLDDVQSVHHNADISDDELARILG